MNRLLNAQQIAVKLRVPSHWVIEEAKAERIPCLRAGEALLFDAKAVQAAMGERAAILQQDGKLRSLEKELASVNRAHRAIERKMAKLETEHDELVPRVARADIILEERAGLERQLQGAKNNAEMEKRSRESLSIYQGRKVGFYRNMLRSLIGACRAQHQGQDAEAIAIALREFEERCHTYDLDDHQAWAVEALPDDHPLAVTAVKCGGSDGT